MAFSYHPPTRSCCEVCDLLAKKYAVDPIIQTYEGKASSANGYPFHDWYNFVLGFTPTFPEYMLNKENISAANGDVVLDPFGGSGTTQLVCKLNGIKSYGIDANDFMVFAASKKLDWNLDPKTISILRDQIVSNYNEKVANIDWENEEALSNQANEMRVEALDKRYISDKPLIKIEILRNAVAALGCADEYKEFLSFAISSILVPVSNVKYGPGFGIGKIKDDVDVLATFNKKIDLMIKDLSCVTDEQKGTFAETILGDSRQLSQYLEPDSISLIVTSPPYPGDHEYTKHSKLELIFQGYATDLASFRTIKKRMIRGSTTNIYRQDNERSKVADIAEIAEVTDEIDKRLKNDGATSGFEKLYTKLIWEYFGGMYNALEESLKVLKPGGKIALLVSDSHAFKMVHIQTAELLKKVGEKAGFVNAEILLWQNKPSTSHRYQLRENILILQKPE